MAKWLENWVINQKVASSIPRPCQGLVNCFAVLSPARHRPIGTIEFPLRTTSLFLGGDRAEHLNTSPMY